MIRATIKWDSNASDTHGEGETREAAEANAMSNAAREMADEIGEEPRMTNKEGRVTAQYDGVIDEGNMTTAEWDGKEEWD